MRDFLRNGKLGVEAASLVAVGITATSSDGDWLRATAFLLSFSSASPALVQNFRHSPNERDLEYCIDAECTRTEHKQGHGAAKNREGPVPASNEPVLSFEPNSGTHNHYQRQRSQTSQGTTHQQESSTEFEHADNGRKRCGSRESTFLEQPRQILSGRRLGDTPQPTGSLSGKNASHG
jgi:hypothetical protein